MMVLIIYEVYTQYLQNIEIEFFCTNFYTILCVCFADNVRAICPFLERIPAVDHEEFLDDFVSTVVNMKLRRSIDNENDFKFISPYKLVVAYARKNGVCIDSGFEFLNDVLNENNRDNNQEKKLN